jgi:hypothetical protein
MYKYNLIFSNTLNSVVCFSPDGRNIRENNKALEELSSQVYLKERKKTLQNYNNLFQTEIIANDHHVYCYVSIKNHRILFNYIPIEEVSFVKECVAFSSEQLERLHKISKEDLLGRYSTLLESGYPAEFRVINTCDSFIKFVNQNKYYLSKKARKPFYEGFQQILNALGFNTFPSDNICSIQKDGCPHLFRYIHFYDLIIITGYEKENIENNYK